MQATSTKGAQARTAPLLPTTRTKIIAIASAAGPMTNMRDFGRASSIPTIREHDMDTHDAGQGASGDRALARASTG
jgi:hypothetical protein